MPGDRFIELAMAEDRHVLDVLFRHAVEGVTVQDRSGRLIYANDRAASMVGLASGEEMIRANPSDLLAGYEMIDSGGRPVSPDDLPGRRVMAGEPVAEAVVGYRRLGGADVRWSSVRASPIKDDDGNVVWALNFVLDITGEVREERVRTLMTALQGSIGSSLDPQQVVEATVGLLVPAICSAASVHVVDDAGILRSVAPRAVRGAESHFDLLTVPKLQSRLVDSGANILFAEPEDLDMRTYDASPQDFRVACLALRAGERMVGTLTVVASAAVLEADRGLLTEVARRSGVALANALLFSHQHHTADLLQRGLRPGQLPPVPGFDLAVLFEPQAHISGASGDFYDVVPLGDKYLVFVGDIEGKGIPAAASVGIVRHSVRTTAALGHNVDTVFRQVNDVLLAERPARMCTLAWLVIEPGEQPVVSVALAGHPPPIVITAAGEISLLGTPCPPFGVLDSISPTIETRRLDPGDTLILYTDGFSITAEPDTEALARVLKGAESEELNAVLHGLMAGIDTPPRDDVVLLALRVKGGRD